MAGVTSASRFKYLGRFTDNTTSLTFSTIPAGYLGLRVIWIAQSDRSGVNNTGGRVTINAFASGYNYTALTSGSSTSAGGQASWYVGQIPAGSRTQDSRGAQCIIDFPFYNQTDIYKSFNSVLSGTDGNSNFQYWTMGHCNAGTDAITTITLLDDVGGTLGPRRVAHLYAY